jgi:hypothetical protein
MSIRTALMEMAKPKTERAEWVPESILDDDVSHFMGAAAAAKKSGKSHFDFGGKKYKVTMKHDAAKKVDESADAISEATFATDIDYNEEGNIKKVAKRFGVKVGFVNIGGATEMQMTGDKNKIMKAVKALGFTDQEIKNAYFKESAECPTCGDGECQCEQPVEEAKVDELSKKTYQSYFKKADSSQRDAEKKLKDVRSKRDIFAKPGGQERKLANTVKKRNRGMDDARDRIANKESVEEAAATAQHGPTKATSDTFDKQMNNGEGSIPMGKKKDFVNMHNMEVALDAEEIYKKNKYEALSKTPARPGDKSDGDKNVVNPIPANPIDGMRAALAKMKLSGE